MIFIRLITVLVCLCFAATGCAQNAAGTGDNSFRFSQEESNALTTMVKPADIYSITVHIDDQPVFEYYKEGYTKDSLFAQYSCTKSIISLLIGMAIEEGSIKSTEQYASDFFPASGIKPGTSGKGEIQLQHLLNQTSGLYWPEWTRPQQIPDLLKSPNWVQFIWSQPMAESPGTTFNYNSGNSHLLSAILQQATGQTTFSYATSHLFQPLAITSLEWLQDPNGVYTGGFGISMTAPDMAKIGLLYLHEGNWQGKQLVSKDWIKRTFTKQSEGARNVGLYGYQCWLRPANTLLPHDVYFASGLGGQYIFVIPDLKAVVTFTSSLPNSESGKPIEILEQQLIPLIAKKLL